MNRKTLQEVLESTRDEVAGQMIVPLHPSMNEQSNGVLRSIINRVMPEIIRRESLQRAYEICYRHVFEVHNWPTWCETPFNERVDWLAENLTVYGFDEKFPN